MRYGFKIEGCFGDVLYSTPVLRYLSVCHNDKIDVETNFPIIFKNNPYVGKIYDTNQNEFLPGGQEFYDCNGHNFEDVQKQIRKMHLTDYWSTHLGFILTPEEKTINFYPDPIDIDLPEGDYIVISPSKTWECRTWDKEKWEKLTEMILKLGIKVVVTGKDISYGDDIKSSIEIDNPNVINLINKLNLSQLWHLVNNSLVTITMNAGLLPFAGTTDVNILELGGAINPAYRSPFRNGSQEYKHKFVGGSCKLFCQSDMKYNVIGDQKITRWDSFAAPACYEKKPTYECHTSVNAAFNGVLEFLKMKNK
jgi:ADP-heptose:LPS heptosyltransferase